MYESFVKDYRTHEMYKFSHFRYAKRVVVYLRHAVLNDVTYNAEASRSYARAKQHLTRKHLRSQIF